MAETHRTAKRRIAASSGHGKAAARAASGPTPAAARPPTPHQRARRDRGEETRDRLIMAGLEVFGRVGFEGASTREIARAANVNLAAIVYHFGGKEQLYLAVAEYIAGRIMTEIAPVALAGPAPTDAAGARALLSRIVETFADIILGEDEAELWARIILREQLQPTAAFDLIYGFMSNMIEVVTGLTALALGRAEDEDIRLRVMTMVGQVAVFRIANALTLRRMDWTAIGDAERAAIKRVVIENIDRILDAEARR